MRKIVSFFGLALWFNAGMAQSQPVGNTSFISHQKLYVAVTVLGIILTCIFIFLFSMERRLRDLEQKQNS